MKKEAEKEMAEIEEKELKEFIEIDLEGEGIRRVSLGAIYDGAIIITTSTLPFKRKAKS